LGLIFAPALLKKKRKKLKKKNVGRLTNIGVYSVDSLVAFSSYYSRHNHGCHPYARLFFPSQIKNPKRSIACYHLMVVPSDFIKSFDKLLLRPAKYQAPAAGS
jgi:hypothetical protein